jgi:periplasmic protein TonB
METNKILQSDYLDLIFDNRNKNYGGYELRKHYNRRAAKALGITLGVLVLGIGTPFVLSKLNAKTNNIMASNIPKTTVIETVLMPPPPASVPPPPEPAAAPAPVARTVIFNEPKIVPPNVKPDLPPPDIKDLKDVEVGPVNNPGEGGTTAATTKDIHTGAFGTGTTPTVTKGGTGIANDVARDFAEVMPEYPGGMAALMAYLQKNLHYPAMAREEGIEGKVFVKFIVNAKGEIENAMIVKSLAGGCDKEALRVINAMPKWKPGKQNGQAVKVFYMLPISFKLQ